ncbi:DUF3592 domain-containing protein [Saccharopolyspora montiporae]|uniref:DUF3592 domain-containing protein n=1 Tax=Saccharopolyspora montiporae TaxID=2781240 RepID=UPI00351C94C8
MTDSERGGDQAGRWTRARIRRLSARGVLVLGALLSVLGVSIVLACAINDRTIEEARGNAVAEVVDTSLTRTVVRFSTDDGRIFIPPAGVLYPEGLQTGQQVRVEYDQRNPDLVRVAERTAAVSLLPVATSLLGVWVVLGPVYWVLRRRS